MAGRRVVRAERRHSAIGRQEDYVGEAALREDRDAQGP